MEKTMTPTANKIKVNNPPSIEQLRQKESRLTTSQGQSETRMYFKKGSMHRITVNVRYDDNCGNGHNSFAITAEIDYKSKNGRWIEYMGGCCHEEVVKYFPKLSPFIKWHLMSSDEPLHYIGNALYWKEQNNEENLESTIIYGALEADYQTDFINMNNEELTSCLEIRLPLLMKEFRKAIESLGFIY